MDWNPKSNFIGLSISKFLGQVESRPLALCSDYTYLRSVYVDCDTDEATSDFMACDMRMFFYVHEYS